MCIEDYVPARILELCLKGGISKYQLSIRTGISQSALSDIAKKKNVPTITTLEKICDAFGITMAQFFTPDDSFPDLSEEQVELLREWKELKLEEKRIIKILIKALLLVVSIGSIGLAGWLLHARGTAVSAKHPSSKTDCYLCGTSGNSPMPEYANSQSIGILYLGRLEVCDTGIRTYETGGRETSASADVQFGFWSLAEGEGHVSITSVPQQGIATIDINYGETNEIDFGYLDRVLCQDCMAKVLACYRQAGDGRCRNVFLIDFGTLELYALPEDLTAFAGENYFFHVDHFNKRDVVLVVRAAGK